jgi:ribonuclease P protein component
MEERLKSRKAIECLFKAGKSFSIFPFRILYQFIETAPTMGENQLLPAIGGLQAGFTVSSRQFKKAVDRNRIKRLMREAYRLQKGTIRLLPQLKTCNLNLFFIYVGKELPEYDLIYEKIGGALSRLMKLTIEKK